LCLMQTINYKLYTNLSECLEHVPSHSQLTVTVTEIFGANAPDTPAAGSTVHPPPPPPPQFCHMLGDHYMRGTVYGYERVLCIAILLKDKSSLEIKCRDSYHFRGSYRTLLNACQSLRTKADSEIGKQTHRMELATSQLRRICLDFSLKTFQCPTVTIFKCFIETAL
jgi:hypothetical protein